MFNTRRVGHHQQAGDQQSKIIKFAVLKIQAAKMYNPAMHAGNNI
jgi:hypothetical protein